MSEGRMALMFLDGFEGYSSLTDCIQYATDSCNWQSFSYRGSIYGEIALNTDYRTQQVTSANSRCLAFKPTSGYSGYTKATMSIPGRTDLIVGGAFKATNTAAHNCISFADKIAIGYNTSLALYANVPGTWGAPSTSVASTGFSLTQGVWHYIEARVKLGTTDGEFEVHVDGTSVLNLTGINTAGGLTQYTYLAFGGMNGYNPGMNLDDLYICDNSGTTNNTFLGAMSVYSLLPEAAGSVTQMDVTGAAANWDAVNDVTSDYATSYVSTNTTGNQDYYTFQNLPADMIEVAGVMISAKSTLGSSGPRKLILNLKDGASNIASSLKTLLYGSWLGHYFVSDTAPDGTAWTPAKVNSTEGGIEAG